MDHDQKRNLEQSKTVQLKNSESVDVELFYFGERINAVRKFIQYSVYGFIRESRSLFPKDNSYYNIPKLIDFIVVLYYDHTPEYFKMSGEYIIVTDDRMSARSTDPSGGTIYGNIGIKHDIPAIYKWRFKILDPMGSINIGIDSAILREQMLDFCFVDHDFNENDDESWKDRQFYSIDDTGEVYSHIGRDEKASLDISIENGEFINMIVNTKDCTILFETVDQHSLINNVKFDEKHEFYLAIYLGWTDQGIQMTHFSQKDL